MSLTRSAIPSGEAMVRELGLAETLRKLQAEADRSGVSIGKLFESKEALLAITALARGEFSKFNELVAEMADRTGKADEAWQRYTKTTAAASDTFKNTIEKELILFGERIAPTVVTAMKDIGAGWKTIEARWTASPRARPKRPRPCSESCDRLDRRRITCWRASTGCRTG